MDKGNVESSGGQSSGLREVTAVSEAGKNEPVWSKISPEPEGEETM